MPGRATPPRPTTWPGGAIRPQLTHDFIALADRAGPRAGTGEPVRHHLCRAGPGRARTSPRSANRSMSSAPTSTTPPRTVWNCPARRRSRPACTRSSSRGAVRPGCTCRRTCPAAPGSNRSWSPRPTPSSIGGSADNFPSYPGQLRQVVWSLVARGARLVEYWHWHSLHYGAETYWGGILGHSLRAGPDLPRARRRRHRAASAAGDDLPDLRPAATSACWFPPRAAGRWSSWRR